MKIMLTGADGFIGKNVRAALEERQIDLVGSVDISFFADTVDNIKRALQNSMQAIDTIVHLGAISNTLDKDVNKIMKYNYFASKMIFDIAAEHKKRVVFASSASIYGDRYNIPSNLYAWSKMLAEDYAMNKPGLDFIGLRYFNVYGPGEEHKKKMASVAYQAYQECHSHQVPFILFNGKPRRDFVYVNDVVSATLHALSLPIGHKGCYEVGTGEARTFEDVLDCLGIPFRYYEDDLMVPIGYQYYTCSDRERWLPGWQPTFTLEQGLHSYKGYLEDHES